MELDIDLSKLSHEDLLSLYNRTKEVISYLNSEIETSEVEKKGNG